MPITMRIARIITTTISSIRVNPSSSSRNRLNAVLSTGATSSRLAQTRRTSNPSVALLCYLHGIIGTDTTRVDPSGPPTRTGGTSASPSTYVEPLESYVRANYWISLMMLNIGM